MAKETYSRTCVGQPIGVAFIQQVLFSQHPEPEHVVRDLLPQHQRLQAEGVLRAVRVRKFRAS